MSRQSIAIARRHPALTFGPVGGGFALVFVLEAPLRDFLAGRGFAAPSGLMWLFVFGGFLGGLLLARLLWRRFEGDRSPHRGAVIGALIGLFALPVPFYVLEFALVAVRGVPFDPRPGASPVVQFLVDLALLLFVPLFLGALGLLPTLGGTVVLGAIVGYALARSEAEH